MVRALLQARLPENDRTRDYITINRSPLLFNRHLLQNLVWTYCYSHSLTSIYLLIFPHSFPLQNIKPPVEHILKCQIFPAPPVKSGGPPKPMCTLVIGGSLGYSVTELKVSIGATVKLSFFWLLKIREGPGKNNTSLLKYHPQQI